MKFIILRSHYMSKERIILKRDIDKYHTTATLGYLLEFGTFKPSEYILILSEDTDSVQIRPRAIYKNSKGYYIKQDNKRKYLDNTEEIEQAIKEFKEFLEDK